MLARIVEDLYPNETIEKILLIIKFRRKVFELGKKTFMVLSVFDDPIIFEHEQAKLKQLKQEHTAAVREYQLAMGKMQSAKNSRKYQEYQASLDSAGRVEEMNQARLNYQKEDSAENKEIPCLNSSKRCVEQLTNKAIANSFKFQHSANRIALIEQRLEVTEERIDYTSKKKWTNYISTNPVDIIQNLFGGGGVQRDNLAIANLEVRTADLLAAKAELERQQSEEKLEIENEVLHLLLNYEAKERKHELLTSQLETLEQQREVIRIAYRMGRGSTSQILNMENRRDPFEVRGA